MKKLCSKEIMKHFRPPRNVGKMRDYSGLGKAGNLSCGDVLCLYIKVGKDKKGREIIKQASFQTLGCTIAIANSSLITTMVKKKTLEEAMKIKREDLLKKLGKVPPFKIHCSVLAVDALKEAIYDCYLKNKIEIPEDLEKEHQRIIKTKEELEKRYKGFQTFEKEILK